MRFWCCQTASWGLCCACVLDLLEHVTHAPLSRMRHSQTKSFKVLHYVWGLSQCLRPKRTLNGDTCLLVTPSAKSEAALLYTSGRASCSLHKHSIACLIPTNLDLTEPAGNDPVPQSFPKSCRNHFDPCSDEHILYHALISCTTLTCTTLTSYLDFQISLISPSACAPASSCGCCTPCYLAWRREK